MEQEKPVSRAEAVARLWTLGILTWKLDPVQLELYNFFHNNTKKTTVWSCSRRLGKSYALSCIAIEKCLKKPNAIVKFVAPTQKHVKMIIRPLLKQILKDCPLDLRPDFRTADNLYRFQNGSEIQLAGTDSGHAETLRGGDSDICIIDEAGFCDDLSYIVKSILMPTTLLTHGKIIMSSTPPKSIDHEFAEYMEEAEEDGTFIKKIIYDGLGHRITQRMIDEIIAEFPDGEKSSEFRREYLCELVTDDKSSVVPEFTDELQKEIVQEWKHPPYFDAYVSGDLGAKDFTVFLFAYYDFRNAKIIVEDEVVLKGGSLLTTTDLMAAEIKKKEAELWTNKITGEQKAPYLRVCDNDLLVINNLLMQNQLQFQPTDKYDSHAALNNMRMLLKNKQVIINPKCKTLLRHLKYATWATNKKTYKRDPVHGGHYDAVDALKYLIRNVQMTKNPYPANYGHGSGDSWWSGYGKPSNPTGLPNKTVESIRNLFKPKPSIKFNKNNK